MTLEVEPQYDNVLNYQVDAIREVEMIAIVKCSGKQYKVKEGTKLLVDKIEAPEGETIELEPLCVYEKDEIRYISGKDGNASVKAKVLRQTKGPKLLVFKYKSKKGYRKKMGHRRLLSEIEIEKIEAN